MDKSVYVAMTGAKHTALAQAVNSHNLANINTPGFKADRVDFRSVFVDGVGESTRVFSVLDKISSDLNEGAINATGNPLDVAISGPGWIAVQSASGKEAFTRAGNLRVGSSGNLETGAGHPVLGDGGPIAVPPASRVEIGDDGSVSVIALGEDGGNVTVVDRIKLVNPDPNKLLKGKDGLFRLPDGQAAEPDAAVRVVPGSLESSNVSAVGALVEMIDLARTYEMQLKTMRAVQENDQADAQLISVS